MKRLYLFFLLCVMSLCSVAQETYTVTQSVNSADVVENPYGDIIGWDGYNDPPNIGYDSPTDAKYYEMEFEVPVGTQLNSLRLSVTDFHCIDSNGVSRTTFADVFWSLGNGPENAEDLRLMPGIAIFEADGDTIVPRKYLPRNEMANAYVDSVGAIEWDFDSLGTGDYIIRVIHEEPDSLGAINPNEPNDVVFITLSDIDDFEDDFYIVSVLAHGILQISDPYTVGPEVEIDELEYTMAYTDIEWDLQSPVAFCEGSSVILEAPYNEGLTYAWTAHFGDQENSIAPVGTPNVVEISESTPFFSVTDYFEMVATTPGGDTLMTKQFTFVVDPLPLLVYNLEYEGGGIPGECEYLFQVHVEDSLGFVTEADDFMWTVAEGYDNLYFGTSDTEVSGTSIYFCFNPVPGSTDSIAEFFVTATNSFGCTTQENKYVVIEDGIPVVKTLTDTTDTNVSIDEMLTVHEVLVYPNPARDQIAIEHNFKNATMEIFNSNGVLIRQEMINNTPHNTEINDLSPGIYFIKMRDEVGQVVTRLVRM